MSEPRLLRFRPSPLRCDMSRRTALSLLLLLLAWFLPHTVAADEFVGPFASWADLKRDYHAVGDGQADDTDALQKALDQLGADGRSPILYLPAGTYRITRGLTMTSQMNVGVLGDDPARVKIVWDGPPDGVMLRCNGVRYSRFGRLTWDGRGKAQCAVAHQWDGHTPGANTHNEHADEVFQDIGYGIRAGLPHFMDAECPVLRCRFIRCSQAGVSIESFNALDWWLWNCEFDDCRVGVTNDPGAGHFHVYNSLFRRSTVADMTMRNTSNYFGIRGNVSLDSQTFFIANPIGANGASVTLQGNTVINPKDAPAIRFDSMGPLLLLDNFFSSRKAPVISVADDTPYLLVGNTFRDADTVQGKRRVADFDNRTLTVPTAVVGGFPALLPVPRTKRSVTEIKPGSDAQIIQAALSAATRLRGKRPIVHLAVGIYTVDRTLTIPAGSDVQLVGDGYATVLRWSGKTAGPVLRLSGPSRATLRDFTIDANKVSAGVVVTNCDQPGARVFMEQGEGAANSEANLLVDRLRHTNVELHDFYHSDCPGVSVRVIGPTRPAEGRVCLFGGASSNNGLSYDVADGGRLLAEDIWYEGAPMGFLHLTGVGSFTLSGAEIATGHPGPNAPKQAPNFAGVETEGFRGNLALLGVSLDTHVAVNGSGAGANALFIGQGQGTDYFAANDAQARALRLGSLGYVSGTGSTNIPDLGRADPAWLRQMLAQVRREHPRAVTTLRPSVTDVRVSRVNASNGTIGIHLTAAR